MNPLARFVVLLALGAAGLLALPPRVARAGDAVVLTDDDFLDHWSEPALGASTEGKPYHGPFGNQTVSLTLDHLPTHRWMKVSFELYIIGSWDGSSPVWGPDLWSLSVRGAQRLIFTSFCGWGYAGNDEQSYPDDYPHALHPAWTGVAARGVVEIKDSDPPKNGFYKVEVLFPHADERLILDFAGLYQDPPSEQQVWGLGHVEARPLPEAAVTDADALPKLWDALAGEDGVEANQALWQFVGAGEKAAAFIKEKVDRMTDDATLSEAEGLRLHRAHRIVRIIGAKGSGALCFRMDRLSIEYANKYRGR